MMTRTLACLLLSVAACAWSVCAPAQQYPTRPIRIVVPYPPGGNTDIVARVYGEKLGERIGQPVVMDNRGGAAGTLGVGLAVKSPNDGYTLVIGDLGSLVIGPIARPDIGYDPQQDLAPVSLMAQVSIVVTVHPKSPINSIADFLALARAQPGKLTVGAGGVGAPGHLAFEMLRSMTGIDALYVPFKGGAQAVTGLLGEQVDVVMDGSAMAQVTAGRLKAVAVTGPRLAALPDVPGIGETVKGYSFTNWWGILAPVGTPAGVVNRLNEQFVAIAALPEVRRRLNDLGLAAQGSTPQQLGELIRTETEKVANIVKVAGIKIQ